MVIDLQAKRTQVATATLDLAPFEKRLQEQEALLRAYGVYEKLIKYISAAPRRLEQRINVTVRGLKKPPSETALRRIRKEQQQAVLKLIEQQVSHYIQVAHNARRRQAFLDRAKREQGLDLISTGEAAALLETTSLSARTKLRRLLEKGMVRGIYYLEEGQPESGGKWYWERSDVKQLRRSRKSNP